MHPVAALKPQNQKFPQPPDLVDVTYRHVSSSRRRQHVDRSFIPAGLGVIEMEGLVEAAAIRGGRLLELVEPLCAQSGVLDVRGLRLPVVVEFDEESVAAAVGAHARRNGLLLRQQRNSLMAIPPLVMSDDAVTQIAQNPARSVREAAHDKVAG